MKKKDTKKVASIINRRAQFDYSLKDELTTGIVLTGPEVKSARNRHVQLKGSFVTIRNNELWLNNATFSIPTPDTSPRKLLASRRQINKLAESKQAGFSIVPLKMLVGGRYIKVVIALGKGKKQYDKREVIKKRDQERDIRRTLKERGLK